MILSKKYITYPEYLYFVKVLGRDTKTIMQLTREMNGTYAHVFNIKTLLSKNGYLNEHIVSETTSMYTKRNFLSLTEKGLDLFTVATALWNVLEITEEDMFNYRHSHKHKVKEKNNKAAGDIVNNDMPNNYIENIEELNKNV